MSLLVGAAPPQQITLVSDSPSIRVTGIRGADPPTVTGGYGGWQKISRPRRKGLTAWQGIDPLEMRLPLLFDGYPDASVELPCGRLEQLAGIARTKVGNTSEPPILRVIGAVPARTPDWVVETLEWIDPVIWSEDGYRLRQGAVVTLLEYVADDRLLSMDAAEQARHDALAAAEQAARQAGVGGVPPAHRKHYTVRQGDTLASIASEQLGDYRRWPEISDLNDIRDPRRVRVGQVLRLP
jgi:hypothetical protein